MARMIERRRLRAEIAALKEMISGRKMASTAAFSISSALEAPHGRRREHLS